MAFKEGFVMALNKRQLWILNKLQELASVESNTYLECQVIGQMWNEEFKINKDNDMSIIPFSDYEPYAIGIDTSANVYSNLNSFINRNVEDYISFWDGGIALDDTERGKFARRIKSLHPQPF